MIIIEMDKMSAPSSWERAQRLYEKNNELESKRRKSAQARIPSDPNAWQQMRENYEAIILEDHGFSEQHNIEYALWQLHYRRIEELRAHFNAALASTGSKTTQGVPIKPDRVTKIRLQFKTFLSEATGFYHDLILKIRAKYGLPLGYFSEDSNNRIVMEKDGKKSADMKKGLISCHRCLIYLGDLARYKGSYGEGDSKTREYAAASSYYLQATSIWPSSGNPHHQLAILASYSGDELVAIYQYFRSLAVESPFSTARENLIVAFEKNRQSYSQLPGNVKTSTVKEQPGRFDGKGRGKGEAKFTSKDTSTKPSSINEGVSILQETYKSFCIRFVRLNGILFTRTSLETFAEILFSVNKGLAELLSSGPEEVLSFGTDSVENGLVIVRVISILIFTVHNVNKESEGQTYAEIVQRAVLLQNAHAAVFELMGCILERCSQLQDPSSSFLLPGILVFVEWLACCPEIAAGSDVHEKEATIRSKFWNVCISFFNKLLSVGPTSVDDDEDETFFSNLSRYDEGETENRLALWEDFELRGFLPLLPAQSILDFNRKNYFGSDGNKEKSARLKRIVAAGKALANIVKIDKTPIYYNSKAKKFCVGVETEVSDDLSTALSGMPNTVVTQESQLDKAEDLVVVHSNRQRYVEGEDEDEVIVFKPIVAEKQIDAVDPQLLPFQGLGLGQNASASDSPVKLHHHNSILSSANLWTPLSISNTIPPHLQQIQSHSLNWPAEEVSHSNCLKGLSILENGHVGKSELNDISISNSAAFSIPFQQPVNVNNITIGGMFHDEKKLMETVIPSKIDTIAFSGGYSGHMGVGTFSAMPTGVKRNSVSRPVRHPGPPPGFSPVPPKQFNDSIPGSEIKSDNQIMDDYSWLDGYHLPSSSKGLGLSGSIHYPSHSNALQVATSNGLSETVGFPFLGKHVPTVQSQIGRHNGWQDNQMLEQLKQHHEQQLQPHQQLVNGNQHFIPLPEQYSGQSTWTSRYFL